MLVLVAEVDGEGASSRIVADPKDATRSGSSNRGSTSTAYSLAGRYGQETLDAVEVGGSGRPRTATSRSTGGR
jgi:hypothetical protein